MPQTWKPLACPSLAPQIQGLHTGPLKYHPDNSTLIAKLGRSPGPGNPQPAPAGSSLPKPPAPTSYLGFSFCESSSPFFGEGGGSSCQAAKQLCVQANSCVRSLSSSPPEGREEGPEPSNPSEPCVLEQNLENDEDGTQTSPEPDGGAGTRSGPGGAPPRILLAPCFCLLSPGPCSVLQLTSLSPLTSCPTRDSYTGSPVLHPTLVPASPTHPTRLFILRKPPALEFLFTLSLLSAPYSAGTLSSSLCTIPQDAITTSIPKGPLAHLPLPPRRAHLSCRDSGRTSIRSSQWSFSTISSSTQRSYNACCR